MNYTRFWLLAAKRLSGDATKEELCELDILMSEHPEAFQFFQEAEKAWTSSPSNLSEPVTEEKLSQLRKKLIAAKTNYPVQIEEDWTTTISRRKKISYILVPVILLVAVAAFFFLNRSEKNIESAGSEMVSENKVFAEKGSKTKITLPDGSTVLLNADSRIYYGNDFNTHRELKLEGEAFFDVVKDENRPFVIHTSEMDVLVLGTIFNVRSYPGESLIEASLIKGSIEVTLKNRKEQPFILKPNEKISIATTNEVQSKITGKRSVAPEPIVAIQKIVPDLQDNIIKEIAWTQNKLYIHGETLDNVTLKLERWFGKPVRIENERLKMVRYTGHFADESLETVLQALQLSEPFKYRIEKDVIIIY